MSFKETPRIKVEHKLLAQSNESMISVNHDNLYDHDMEEVT